MGVTQRRGQQQAGARVRGPVGQQVQRQKQTRRQSQIQTGAAPLLEKLRGWVGVVGQRRFRR